MPMATFLPEECVQAVLDADSDKDDCMSDELFSDRASQSEESGPESAEEIVPKHVVSKRQRVQESRTPSVQTNAIGVKPSSAPGKQKGTTPRAIAPHSRSRCQSYTPSVRQTASSCPKVLNMDAPKSNVASGSLSQILGNITNMLGNVMERLDKTDSKLESMERKLNTSVSSSGSGSERKRTIPTVVRTELRKVYKVLLDEDDDFTGFDLSPQTSYKDDINQSTANVLVKEVCSCNPNFSTSDIRSAAYTYYKSLCQEEAQKRKGMYGQRKVQRRRRERVVRRCAERDSQFNRMSYTEADRTKWKKVLLTEYISSDESGEEDGQAVFFVKELTWRSVRVSSFFEKLDKARDVRKSEQASRQTKPRIKNKLVSSRPPPSSAPSWAIVK